MSKLVPLLETLFLNKGGSPQLWQATQDVLSQKADEARNFCSYMKTKLRDMNQDTQLLALDFLDYSVDNGKMPLWTQVGTKDFLMCLITLLKTRDVIDVQKKILFLIEKWGKKFDHYKEILPTYKEMYSNLKSAGVVFPAKYHSMYSNYTENNNKSDSQTYEDNDDFNNQGNAYNDINKKTAYNSNSSYSEIYSKLGLNENLFEKKYKKLVLKLIECIESIILSNDMIDNSKLGKIDELLKNIIHDLRHANSQLIETISSDKLKDERLMEISLGISEDISRTLKRYDAIKKERKPEPLLSYFMENSNDSKMRNTNKDKPIQPQQQQHSLLNIFDEFDNPPQVNQPIKAQTQNQSSSSNVDDLFDIFSNPQPVNNTTSNTINPQFNLNAFDMFSNSNPLPKQENNNCFNQGINLFDQISLNAQQNQTNDYKPDILAEQLKMIYGNNNNSNLNANQAGNIGSSNINMNNNLFNITQSKPCPDTNTQSNMGNYPLIPNQSDINYQIINQINQNPPNQSFNLHNSNILNNNNNTFNKPLLSINQYQMSQSPNQNPSQTIPNPYSSLFN